MRRSWLFVAAAIGIVALWTAWFVFLVSKGVRPYPNEINGFETTGQFGDSFGFLASLMSTLAVVGALITLYYQRKNNERQIFEQNFYIILQSVRNERDKLRIALHGPESISDFMSKKASYHEYKKFLRSDIHEFIGPRCVALQVLRLRDAIGEKGFIDVKQVARKYRDIMSSGGRTGNYFRLLYHLYVMIDNAPVDDKLFYARIVRAHLSSVEASLLAYNCIVGEGRHKFRALIEKYSVLHNMERDGLDDHARAELKFFERKIGPQAFRFEEAPPVQY